MAKKLAKTKQAPSLRLSDLAAWKRNPRQIDDAALAGLGVSMESFGDLATIVFNKRLGCLVAGHQRVKQLRAKANGEDVPVQMLTEDLGVMVVGGKAFSVRVVDMDETTHAAAAIAANSRHIAGEWVEEDLAGLLGELAKEEVDFEGLRFDTLETDIGMFNLTPVDPPSLPSGDREPFQQMTFTLHDSQVETVKQAIDKAKHGASFDDMPNENSNGNALAVVAGAYLGTG